jgi:putative transposase
VSERRACAALCVNRSTIQYRSRQPAQPPLEARIKEICQTRVRYGARSVHVQLWREVWTLSHKKTARIYNELGMQLRRKTSKRRGKAKLRDDRCESIAANETWAMDFVQDQVATGRKLRVPTIADTFSRFCPAADARFSYCAESVVATLDRACSEIGFRRRSGSIRAASSSPANSISGPV